MKKLVLTLLAFGTLTFAGLAQNGRQNAPAGQSTPQTPSDKAEIEAGQATKKFALNEAQRGKFKQFALERLNANRPLREQMKTTTDVTAKKSLQAQIRANRDIFYNNVKGIMTPEQQVKWAESRSKFERKKTQEHAQE